MMKTKVCFIGCGGIGNYHFSHLVEFEDVEFLAFCDLKIERAQNFKERSGQGNVYTDYKLMLESEKPDCVYICVEPCAHGEIEEIVVGRYGLHVFVEKPMALSMELAEKTAAMIKEKGVVSSIGFQDRYLDIIEVTKEMIKDRAIGLISGG